SVSFQPWTGDYNAYTTVSVPSTGNVFRTGNDCLWGNDVLGVVVNPLNAQAYSFYENVGTHAPNVSGVFTPLLTGKIYQSYVDGFDPVHLFSNYDGSSLGRISYYFDLFQSIAAASICQLNGVPLIALDVPGTEGMGRSIDFMAVRNNPVTSGMATVHFGLARAGRVEARVYDVTGRLVRTLADRVFPAGEHDLVWDGSDDQGRSMSRGVYFTQVQFPGSGFKTARKLTILR
ncbi:MAG TPA: FlgD immunoglobulin-like domain containing protein, partial [Candidatus Eisenbacteria bacterium]